MHLIQVENRSRKRISAAQIRNAAKLILNALGYTDCELSILVVGDDEMAGLNREYRQIDHATDVLSFPMLEGEFPGVAPEMLGDVVISADTAKEIGEQTGTPFKTVIDLLLVHGILHLLGLDHEAGPAEAAAMREKTGELLSMLGHSEADLGWFFDAESQDR